MRNGLFAGFAPVDLEVFDTQSVIPRRHDCKYVISSAALQPMAELLARHFLVLEIDGRRAFRYETCYFDDPALRCYHDHRQGRRRRYKVRVRSYLDSDLHYLEVKLKTRRGATLKLRQPYRHPGGSLSSAGARDFVADVLAEAYGIAWRQTLQPRLDVHYSRTTLVSRSSDERITVDRRICFRGDGQRHELSPDRWIIESKGSRRNGQLPNLIRRFGHHPVRGCSKYCIGMGITGQVQQVNRFLPAMKRLVCARPGAPGGAAGMESP